MVENISDKVITKLTIEVRWQEVRGDGSTSIWELDFSDPADSIRPGGHWGTRGKHLPGYRPTLAKVDYDNKPAVKPKARAHALSVTFSDGTTYSEPPDTKARPLE